MAVNVKGIIKNKLMEGALLFQVPSSIAFPDVSTVKVDIKSDVVTLPSYVPPSAKEICDTVYFDLSDTLRAGRREEEKIWKEKHSLLNHTYLKGPSGDFMVLGTSGIACYALEGPNIDSYKEHLIGEERGAILSSINFRIETLHNEEDGTRLMDSIIKISKIDDSLAPTMKSVGKKISDKIRELRAAKGEKAFDIADRPKIEDPKVEQFVPSNNPLDENLISYNLWCITPAIEGDIWRKTKLAIKCVTNSIPAFSFSSTHLALLCQTGENSYCASVFRLTDIGRPAGKPSWTQSGIVNAEGMIHVNDDGKVVVSVVGGVLFYDGTETKVLQLAGRQITCCSWSHKMRLILGTQLGEAVIIHLEKMNVHNVLCTPAQEPVKSIFHSGYRILVRTSMELTCVLEIEGAIIHLSSYCAHDVAICGQLIFVLEKYGSLQIYDAQERGVIYVLSPPKGQTIGSVVPFGSRRIDVSHDRVLIVYPSGLTRIVQIKNKSKKK